MTRFSTIRLPRALYSMLTRSNLILMVVAVEPLHDFTKWSDESASDYLRVPSTALRDIFLSVPLLRPQELKSLISRQVSNEQLSLLPFHNALFEAHSYFQLHSNFEEVINICSCFHLQVFDYQPAIVAANYPFSIIIIFISLDEEGKEALFNYSSA